MNCFKRKALFTAVLAGLAATTLAGCPSLPLSAEQAGAGAKVKDLNVFCGTNDTLPADQAVLNVNVDKGVVENGELDVKCGHNTVKFTNSKAPK